MASTAKARPGERERETVPFRVRTADGEVVQVDFSESHRYAIAGLHCATLELVRDQDDS